MENPSPQLTLRAVVMGMLLGAVMSFSNLYVGLKIGWGLGVAITACILSYAIFQVAPLTWLQAPGWLLGFDRHDSRQVSILENNCMQSTASAAGYSTGATLVSAFPAYVMITGHHLPFWTAVTLVLCLGLLGIFMAIPMKRSLIDEEKLPFPSGTAAAVLLRALHDRGDAGSGVASGTKRARALFVALGVGAVSSWFRDGRPALLPTFLPISSFFERLGFTRAALIASPAGFTLTLETSTIMAAAGAIMGLRTALSMALGAIVNYGLLAPALYDRGIIHALGFRGIVYWSVWCGVAIMTSAGLLNFFWNWRSLVRALKGIGALLGGRRNAPSPTPVVNAASGENSTLAASTEVPGSWFAYGFGAAAVGTVLLEWHVFGIAPAYGMLAIGVSFILAIVACRATGETDVTPIGALGKITQLLYGVIIPQNVVSNLMTANITSATAAGAADLLTDLKSGHLLGASPRKQFLAQFFGVFVGAVAATFGFYLVVPDPKMLGGDLFPAPAAQVWKAVAELLAQGVSALPRYAPEALFIGLAVGAALTVVEKCWPRVARFFPSPTGLGLAFVVQGYSALAMALGAMGAALYARRRPAQAEAYVVPVASGLIAGESLVGIGIAILSAMKVL